MTRSVSKSERRAMADALRGMQRSGVRTTDIMHGAGATLSQVMRSLYPVLPGRDGIDTPSAGVVTPRQSSSSLAGGKTSQLAGSSGTDLPVAPASFPGGQHRVDGIPQGRTGDVVGLLGHGGSVSGAAQVDGHLVSRTPAAVIGNGRGVLPCDR